MGYLSARMSDARRAFDSKKKKSKARRPAGFATNVASADAFDFLGRRNVCPRIEQSFQKNHQCNPRTIRDRGLPFDKVARAMNLGISSVSGKFFSGTIELTTAEFARFLGKPT